MHIFTVSISCSEFLDPHSLLGILKVLVILTQIMLPKWLLLAALTYSLTAAIICDPNLGRTIRPGDCRLALAILLARLTLSGPRSIVFDNVPHAFLLNAGDPRYSMPQGSSFGTCGIGIDIAPAPRATTSWEEIAQRVQSLITTCSRQGLGGTAVFGQFTVMIVDTGQGMRNLAGTCMSSSSSQALPLLWQMKERLCGFQTLAPLLPPPDSSQLPAPPALFPMQLVASTSDWPPYKVRGQWVWNANVWSPILGNGLNQPSTSAAWVLLTCGGPQRTSNVHATPIYRTVPRIMGTAWFRQQTANPPRRIRGAWGAQAYNWTPLTGDLTNVQLYIDNFDWVLVELDNPGQAGAAAMPAPQARISVPALRPPPQLFGQARAPAPGPGQAQVAALVLPPLRLPAPGFSASGLRGGQPRGGTNLRGASRLDSAQTSQSAEGSRQIAGAAEAAGGTNREASSGPSSQVLALQAAMPSGSSVARLSDDAVPPKRPRQDHGRMGR